MSEKFEERIQDLKTQIGKNIDDRLLVDLQNMKMWSINAINEKTGNTDRTLKAFMQD